MDYSANLALSASVTDSSENVDQAGIKAIDGIVDGSPHNASQEWVSAGQLGGAWIQLNWAQPVTASLIVLHDRTNSTDNIQGGTLTFSDGSSVPVPALTNSGDGVFVTFSPRTINWVRFSVDQAVGSSAGLAEIEVYGTSANHPSFPPGLFGGPSRYRTLSITHRRVPCLRRVTLRAEARCSIRGQPKSEPSLETAPRQYSRPPVLFQAWWLPSLLR